MRAAGSARSCVAAAIPGAWPGHPTRRSFPSGNKLGRLAYTSRCSFFPAIVAETILPGWTWAASSCCQLQRMEHLCLHLHILARPLLLALSHAFWCWSTGMGGWVRAYVIFSPTLIISLTAPDTFPYLCVEPCCVELRSIGSKAPLAPAGWAIPLPLALIHHSEFAYIGSNYAPARKCMAIERLSHRLCYRQINMYIIMYIWRK